MKNLFILGDSYSTFEGCVPEGYNPYYHAVYGEDHVGSDVTSPDMTWWGILSRELELNVVRNDSWSGSTICYTAYHGVDCSETSSFICRFERLVREGFFEKNEIDTVIVFGGTNDAWARAPLGNDMFADHTKNDLYSILPAVGYLAKRLTEQLPTAKILFVINSGIGIAVREGIKRACHSFNLPFAELVSISKHRGHPNAAGMREIAEQVKAVLTAE